MSICNAKQINKMPFFLPKKNILTINVNRWLNDELLTMNINRWLSDELLTMNINRWLNDELLTMNINRWLSDGSNGRYVDVFIDTNKEIIAVNIVL